MTFLNFAKKHLINIPYPIGNMIAKVPYHYRPGIRKIYLERKNEILLVENLPPQERNNFIFQRVKSIAVHAYKNIPFYKGIYDSHDVNPLNFNNLSDIKNLPIINKNDLQQVDLEYRSFYKKGRSLVNTGGSSGNTLEFYIEPSSIGHEWAHMHTIWKKLNFSQDKLKIVFGGRADIKNIIAYDSARHQINVDIYAGWKKIANHLLIEFERYSPQYLHGYPSAIFDFIIWLSDNTHPLLEKLQKNIRGIFLGSEFPHPYPRQEVEKILDCKTISWYGHTERAILAYEKNEKGQYCPFLSYGFAESVPDNLGQRLISTSYYNFASPLIRYDTGDYIHPTIKDSLLESFTIEKGRSGEFILDKNHNKIFLTALIFGRHHEIFNYTKNIQIHQVEQGKATVLVTLRDNIPTLRVEQMFDSSNVEIDFQFLIIPEPYRTQSGKVPLLVKNFQ